MTPERIAELRKAYNISGWQHGRHVTECLDEIERLQNTMADSVARAMIVISKQAEHIRRLREALMQHRDDSHDNCKCSDCLLLSETEPK